MPVIPEYFATEQMETSRAPRAPAYLAYTGQGLEAEGLIGLGRALSDLSSEALQNIINVRSESQFLEGTSQWERAHTQFFTGLAQDQDFENYGVKYKAFAKSLRRQILKKGLTTPARRELEEYMENQQVSKEKQMAGMFLAKQKDFGRVSAFESVIKFEQAGDFDGAISAINHAQAVGFMSAEEAFKRKQDVRANIAGYQRQTFIVNAHEAAKAMPYRDAIGYLNDLEGITSAERNDLIARRKRQDEIETATRDDEVYWDLLRRVTKDAKSVGEEEIASWVKPNGITTDDYKELIKIKASDADPLKTPRAQLYFNSLDSLYDERETDAEQRLNYDISNEKLMQFFKENPKATAQQAAEFYEELINPELESWLSRIFTWESPAERWRRRRKAKKPEEVLDIENLTDEELEAELEKLR